MHSNSPLHLYSVYLLYIYTYIHLYILTYMAHPCDARSISTCADFRQTIRSAYLILRFRYIYLSPLPSLPLPLTPCHVTPHRCVYVCVCVIGCGASLFQVLLRCDAMWLHICGSFRALFELGNSLFGFSSLLVVCSCVCPRVVCVAL